MIIAVDDIFRERLFILTIAAERGWRLASRVAFRKKGDYADKDLAKELKEEERRKRKLEDTDRQAKKKKPNFGNRDTSYRQNQPPQASTSGGYQRNAPQRVETRTCINCRQVGHLLRNCPSFNAQGNAAKY